MENRFRREILLVVFLLVIITVFTFRKAIFNNLIPGPFNFMAFWYEPFKSQTWPGYPLGIPHKAIGADIFRNLYPLKNLAIELLTSGRWPLWNPYNFSGTPLLANFQTSVFYPTNFLYFLLPFGDAWTINILIQPFFAGLFMYLLVRTLKVSLGGALFSATSFALLPFLIIWYEHGVFGQTLLWLPLILFAIEKLNQRISWWSLALITFGFTFAVLGGHPQPLFFVFLVSIAWAVFRLKKNFFLFFVALIFSFLLTAVQLLPTLELYRLSAINSEASKFIFSKFLLSPSHLITFFIPDFFGNIAAYNFWGPADYTETIAYFGILPLIFGLLAVFWRKDKIAIFLVLIALGSLSLAFPLPSTRFLISLNLPVISTNVPSRIFFITGFAFMILAGLGMNEWQKRPGPSRILLPIGLVYLGAIIFSLVAGRFFSCPPYRPNCWQISLRNTILPAGIFLVGLLLIFLGAFRKRWRDGAVILLIVLNLFEGLYFANKFLAFSDRQFVYPQVSMIKFLQENAGINRFSGLDQARITPNLATFYRIFSPDGYDPLYIKRYGQLLEAANTDGKLKRTISRSDASLASDLGSQRILDLLGVRYILAKEEKDWQIYQNLKSLPRIFLAGEALVVKNDQAILDKIFAPTVDLRNTVILEEDLPRSLSLKNDGLGEAKMISYQPGRVEVATNSLSDKILFISDVFYPGWQVYLDGQKTKIYRADFTFMAAVAPWGKHEVIFSYEPESFYWGLRISGFAFVLLVIWLKLLSRIREES